MCNPWHGKCTMSPPSIRPEGKWVRRIKQGLGGGFPNSFLTNSVSIVVTAFPSPEQSSLPHDLSLGGDDENPIALCCKSISSTRIFNEHTKENRRSDWHPSSLRPRTVGGHSDGPASDIRPHLRQWPAEMSVGSASPERCPSKARKSILALRRSQHYKRVARPRRSRLTAADADFSKPRDEEEGDPAQGHSMRLVFRTGGEALQPGAVQLPCQVPVTESVVAPGNP